MKLEKQQKSVSALFFCADKKNQSKILKEIAKFGDVELVNSFKSLFSAYTSDEIDSYLAPIPIAQCRIYNSYSAFFMILGTKAAREKHKELSKDKEYLTLEELLLNFAFKSNALASLIIENDVSYRPALIFQIKQFAPTIAPIALKHALKKAKEDPQAYNELIQTCITHGQLGESSRNILREYGYSLA